VRRNLPAKLSLFKQITGAHWRGAACRAAMNPAPARLEPPMETVNGVDSELRAHGRVLTPDERFGLNSFRSIRGT
jgi:hypothetical protein